MTGSWFCFYILLLLSWKVKFPSGSSLNSQSMVRKTFLMYVYEYLDVCGCISFFQVPRESKRGAQDPTIGATGIYESPYVNAGKQNQVFWRSHKFS